MAKISEDQQWLYDKFKNQGYNIGSSEEFVSSLSNEEDLKWYYGKANKMNLNVGTYDEFRNLFAPSKAVDMNPANGFGGSIRRSSVMEDAPAQTLDYLTKFQPKATPSRGDVVPAATTAPKQGVAPQAAFQFEMPNPDIMWGGDTLKDFEQFQPDLSGLSEDEKFIREYENRQARAQANRPSSVGIGSGAGNFNNIGSKDDEWLSQNAEAYRDAKGRIANPLRGKTLEEVLTLKGENEENEAFVEEYERIKKEYDDMHIEDMQRAGKLAYLPDKMLKSADEKKAWLKENQGRYAEAKQATTLISDALEHTPEWHVMVVANDELEATAKASALAIGAPGIGEVSDFDPESMLLEGNQLAEQANWNSVVRLCQLTDKTLKMGSKVDAKAGGVNEQLRQFVEGAVNNVDIDTITFGLASAGAFMDARRIGDKSNRIVDEAIKSTGYEGDVNELEKSINAMGEELAPMGAELQTLAKGLEDMEATYKDMERRGASEAELREYYKEYEKKFAEYKEKYDKYASLAEKYNEALGAFKDIRSAIDNALETGLSDSEKAVLEALDRYTYVTGIRAANISNAANAGQAAEQSAEFMLDFILTGGLGKVGSKAATKLTAKWAARRAGKGGMKNIAANIPEAMNKLVAKGISPSIGATMLTDMGVAAKRTIVMFPRNLRAYGESLVEFNPDPKIGMKDGLGRYNFNRSYLNAALNTAITQYIEYWSEGFGEYFGAAEKALFKASTLGAPATAIGRTLSQYRGSIGKYLDYGKFNGMFNEMLEEVVGSLFNATAGWMSGDRVGDKEAMSNFFAGDNLSVLFFSFLPMSAISAGTNIAAYSKMKDRYDASVETLSSFLEGGSISQADLDALTADITDSTPVHIKDRIVAITEKAREANGGKLPSDFTQSLLGYVEGSLCMQMEGERWADSAEKAQVASSYATTYFNPVYNPWDADKAEQDARKVAEEAGFTEEELNQDPYRMAQNALAMQAAEPERAEALNAYANAKATRQGLEDGYREETMAQTSEEDEYIRGSLDNNGQVITAYLNGEEVFVTAKDATITPDGRITVNGKDGVVTIQREDKSADTAKASQLENASAMDTEMYSLLEVNRIANERQAVYDQAASTISVNGMRQAVTDMVGQTVYLSDGQGVYEPIQIVRSTENGKVVVKGSKNALDAIIVAAQVNIPRGSMVEVDAARIYPMLAQNEDGTLATNAPEQSAQAPALPVPEAETPTEAAPEAPQAPAEAAPVEGPSMSDLQGSERTIYINGNAYNVEVTRANERTGQVEVMYKDEEGNDIPAPDGMPNVFDYSFFVQALSEPVASAPAEAEAPAPEAPVAEAPAAPASTTFDGKSTNQWVRENTPLLFDEEMSDADRAAFVGALEAELEALRAKKAELEDKRENDKPQVTTDLQKNIEARKALRAKYTAQIEALDAEIAERERRLEGIRGVLGEINSRYAPFVPVAAKEQFSAEELTPQTPEEAVAEYIAKNFKSGGQTIDIDDFRRETGYKGEASDFFFLKKGGMTIRELAEHIAAEYPGLFGGAANEADAYASGNEADDSRARNAIIDLFGQVRNKTDINNYVLGHRREQAQAEAERQNADLRHAMEESVGMPLEQYESQRQRMIQEDINAVLGSLPEGSDVAAAMRNYYTEKFGEAEPEAPAEEAPAEVPVEEAPVEGPAADVEDLPFSKRETEYIEENPNTEAKKARIAEWADRLGLPITVLESLDDVKDPQARKEIVFADEARARGGRAHVEGWYNPTTHKVELYLPHLAEDRIDAVVLHEVVAHRGLRELLKTVDKEGNVSYEKFDALMDFVWNDLMSEKDKAKWLAYNSGMKGSPLEWRRAAADEYVAKEFSERLDPNKHPSKWRRFVTRVKQLLKSIGIDIKVSGKDMDNLLLYSLRNYEQNREAVTEEEPQTEEEVTESNLEFSKVTDPATLEMLNNTPTMKVYRSMAFIEDPEGDVEVDLGDGRGVRKGRLYSPMATQEQGEDGRWNLREATALHTWEQADENPAKAVYKNGRWVYILKKPNGDTIEAAYNPYIHTSLIPLNDQFTAAHKRPELVTVEVEIPVSELTSGYKAEKAKDAVGKMDWHAGPVAGQLPEGSKREVVLSRWNRPVRVVPNSEVADKIVEAFKGVETKPWPWNVFTPALRKELIKRGVEFSDEPAGTVSQKDIDAYKNSLRFSRVYHGSGADFDRFDHSHMGEGSGSQSYGWGTYVTTNHETGKAYAESVGGRTTPVGSRHLYMVDIPDDNGENYLHWDGYLTREQSNKIMDAVRDILKQRGEYQDETEYELKSALGFGTVGRQVEGGIDYFLGDMKDYATGEDPGAERDAKILNSLGIVGMEIPIDRSGGQRFPGSNYVIFDENNLKIANHLRFSKANANEEIFISNAEKAVEDIKQEKATPQQWLAQLEKSGGLKAGEDKWLGLSDWLKASDRKTLTKQEVLDYIKENKIIIEETDYSAAAQEEEKKAIQSYQEEFESFKEDPAALWQEADERVAEFYEAMKEKYGEDYLDKLNDSELTAEASLLREREEAEDMDVNEAALQKMREKYGDDFDSAFTYEVNPDGSYVLVPMTDWRDDLTDAAKYFVGQKMGTPVRRIHPIRMDYTTEGLTNKREIALTVPSIAPYNEQDDIHFGDAGEGRAIAWARFGDAVYEDAPEQRKLADFVLKTNMKYGGGIEAIHNMTPEEWEQYRKLSDAVGDEPGKVLVIDEIQSKRHQDAREKGYKTPMSAEQLEELENARTFASHARHMETLAKEEWQSAIQPYKDRLNNDEITWDEYGKAMEQPEIDGLHTAWQALWDEANKAEDNWRRVENEYRPKGIPAAPFEKNWYELAMKRMLRLASEEGYKYLAWTTGEQQAERYSLSQAVSEIAVKALSDDKYAVVIEDKSGSELMDYRGSGKVVDSKELSALVGKELASRLITGAEASRGKEWSGKGENPEYYTIKGDDLKIGGEGMKGFYDDILVRYMNKYGKKWGVKVEDIELPELEGTARTMHAVPITPEMRESVMEGQLMFSKINGDNSENNSNFVNNGQQRRTLDTIHESAAGELGADRGLINGEGSRGVGETPASAESATDQSRLGLLQRGLRVEREKYLAESNRSGGRRYAQSGVDVSGYPGGITDERAADEALVRLAKEAGAYYTPEELKGKFGQLYAVQGYESITFYDPNTKVFTKFKDPFKVDQKFGGPHTPFDVLDEVEAHNLLFPDTPYRFVGVTELGPITRIILQQDEVPHYAETTSRQAGEYVTQLGLEWNPRDNNANNEYIEVGDLSSANAYIDPQVKLRAIDPLIKFKKNPVEVLEYLRRIEPLAKNQDLTAKSETSPLVAEYINAYEQYKAVGPSEQNNAEFYGKLQQIQQALNNAESLTIAEEDLKYDIDYLLDNYRSAASIKGAMLFEDYIDGIYASMCSHSEFVPKKKEVDNVQFSRSTESLPAGAAGNIALTHAIEGIKGKFGSSVKINTVSREQMPKGHKTDKGYYDTRTGEVYICIDNIESIDDAIATVMHEAVAHLGLRQLFGDRFPEAMTAIYEAMSPEIRHEVHASMTRNGWDAITATEEYLARLAEKEEFTPQEKTFWDRVKEIFEAILSAITGKANVSLTDNELRYILQASYMNLTATPAERQGVQYAAREILLKDKYKVNDYVEPEYLARTPVFANGTDSIKNYEESVEKSWQKAQMEFQDAQQPVRIGISAIQAETGNKPITEDEDYLTKENLASSIAQTQQVEYLMSQISPIVEQVAHIIEKISGKKNPSREERAKIYNDIISYLYAKHGAERNRYANAQLAKQEEEADKAKYDENGRHLTEKEREKYAAKDWSGLTSLFGLDKAEHEAAEALADELCEKFEAEVGKDDIDLLWDRIQAATDYNLKHALDSGLLSKDEYDRLHGNKEKGIARMWEHYVPLRGFTEKTAEEEYNYANLTRQQANSVVTKKYKGRTSLASDPIANIVNIGETEIRQGNANLAKIALYRYVMNRPEGKLLTATDMWFVKQDDGTWVLAEPQAKYDASDKQVGTESFEDFENRMEALKAKGLARKGRRNLQLDKIMTNPGHQNEHLIRLKVNGQEKGIWVNGNPQLARAVAGSLRKESMEGLRNLTRSLSNLFTTYSLKFALRNFWRDTLYSQMRLLAMTEENGREYWVKYEANWLKNFGAFTNAPMIRMVSQWNKGTLQKKENPTETEKMFMDFMRDGGPTGYTVTRSVEQVIKDIHKDLNMFRPDGSWLKVMWENASSSQFAKVLGIYPRAVQALNESFELLTRFTAYQTSRQMGRSGQQAASDAKEISVNFNRKGAQSGKGFFGAVAAYFGATHYFFNAGVQGFQNFMSLYQKHPYKMTAFSTMLAMMGFLTPYINALLAAFGGGDDDDDQTLWYWNLPEWTRRSSIVIGTAKGYVAIALGPEQRALYGLGDIIAAYVDGRYANKSAMNIAADVVSQLAGLLPVNPVEDLQGSQNVLDAALRTFMPDPLMAAYDMAVNRDYTGRPLQKENPFSKTSPNCYGAYSSTPDGIVKACQWIAEETAKAGYMVDLPPGYIREVFRQYGGGIYTAFEEAAKFTAGILNEDKPLRTSDFPLTSGVIGSLDDDRKDSFAKNALNEYKSMEQVLTKTMKVLLHDPDITEKGLFEGGLPDDAPKYASRLFESEDFQLAKMYYEGENGKYLHAANGKRIRKQQDGLKDYRKKWNDLKDEYAKMPKGTEEEKKAREKKKEEIEKAWNELVTAENKLVDELLMFEYKHPAVSKKIEDAIKK